MVIQPTVAFDPIPPTFDESHSAHGEDRSWRKSVRVAWSCDWRDDNA